MLLFHRWTPETQTIIISATYGDEMFKHVNENYAYAAAETIDALCDTYKNTFSGKVKLGDYPRVRADKRIHDKQNRRNARKIMIIKTTKIPSR